MNDYSDIGLLKRSFRDVHAVVSRLDTQMRRLIEPAAIDRPGGLVARAAACHLLAKWERRGAEDVARQHFARDNDLHHLIRAASGPAMTGVAGWAAELAAVTVADIATNLLPQSVLTQLRAASGQPYTFVEGSVVKVPIHSPIASGSFVAEGDPIKVGALILTALTLKPKKAPSILAITKELLAGSPLNIELWLRTTLQEDLRLAIDAVLLVQRRSNRGVAGRPPQRRDTTYRHRRRRLDGDARRCEKANGRDRTKPQAGDDRGHGAARHHRNSRTADRCAGNRGAVRLPAEPNHHD